MPKAICSTQITKAPLPIQPYKCKLLLMNCQKKEECLRQVTIVFLFWGQAAMNNGAFLLSFQIMPAFLKCFLNIPLAR